MSDGPGRVFAQTEIDAAVAWLMRDGLLVYPTETFYGLAADPRSPAAVEEIFRCKGRASTMALPLVAGDTLQVELAAPGWRRCALARSLAERFWPGPLTLLLDAKGRLAPGVVAADGSVAIRVTSHPVAGALARLFGFPLTATSANRSGMPPLRDGRAALLAIAADPRVALLDAGPTPGGAPSTIVDPRHDPPSIVREGAIDASAIMAAALEESR
jgi:L-threonylcarbamoyladenylate synthase